MQPFWFAPAMLHGIRIPILFYDNFIGLQIMTQKKLKLFRKKIPKLSIIFTIRSIYFALIMLNTRDGELVLYV